MGCCVSEELTTARPDGSLERKKDKESKNAADIGDKKQDTNNEPAKLVDSTGATTADELKAEGKVEMLMEMIHEEGEQAV